MAIAFDPAKDAANIAKHGLPLDRTGEVEIVAFVETTRESDGERRFRLYGHLDSRPVCAVVTFRDGATRAISLRSANRNERKRHAL